jgi:hypothetical protein
MSRKRVVGMRRRLARLREVTSRQDVAGDAGPSPSQREGERRPASQTWAAPLAPEAKQPVRARDEPAPIEAEPDHDDGYEPDVVVTAESRRRDSPWLPAELSAEDASRPGTPASGAGRWLPPEPGDD